MSFAEWAYLEAEAGAMTPEQGHDMLMCQRVINAWELHMLSVPPQAVVACFKCVGALVLDGSRHTAKR